MSIPGLNMLSIVFEAIFLFTNYVSRLNSLDWVLCPCQQTLLFPLLCNKWMTWRRHVNARFQEISFLHTWPLVYYVGRRISFRLSALNPLRGTQSVIVIKERGRDRCQRRRCQFFPSPIYWLDPIQSTPFFYRHFFYPFLLLQLLSFTLGHKQVVTRTDSRVAIGLTDERERGGERGDDKMGFGDRWLPLGANEIPGKGNDATLVEGKEIRLLLAFGFLLALVSFVAIGNCSTNRLISGKSLGNCQFNKNKC